MLVNRDLGPCVIVWEPDGDNITFSKTHGGVTFRYNELVAPIHRDQDGETVIDEVNTGVENPEVEAPLTEPDLTKLVKCFGDATASADFLHVRNPVGGAHFADAKPVIVKPIVNGAVSTTEKEWLRLHRAYPKISSMEQTYDNAGQRVTNVIFKGFPDDISGRIRETWRHGSKS